MILDSLVLENIRSYTSERVEFPLGITLFEGDVGSGKSTILMAVEFALFGLGSQSAGSLLAKNSSTGRVILNFTAGKNKCEIQRTLEKKSGRISHNAKQSHIKINGEREMLSVTELKQRILQILKFNEPPDPKSTSKIFRYAVFTPQEEMKTVLNNAKIRLETIRKAFGMEDYSIAALNAKTLSVSIEKEAARLEGRFGDIEQLEGEINASKELVAGLGAEISRSVRAKSALELEKEQISAQQNQLQEQRIEKTRLEGKKGRLEEKIRLDRDNTRSARDEIDDAAQEAEKFRRVLEDLGKIKEPTPMTAIQIQDELDRFRQIGTELVRSTARHSELSSLLERLSKKTSGRKIGDLQKEMAGKQEMLDNAQNALKECNTRLEDLKRQETECEIKIKQLKDDMDKSMKLGASCPVCKQDITEDHLRDLRSGYGARLGELNEASSGVKDLLLAAEQDHKGLDAEIKGMESDMSGTSRIIPDIEELSRGSAELGALDDEIAKLRAQNRIAGHGDSASADPIKHLSALKDARMEYESALVRIRDATGSMNLAKKHAAACAIRLKSLDADIKKNTDIVQSVENQLESFSDIDARLESAVRIGGENSEKIIQMSSSIALATQNLENENKRIDDGTKKLAESRKFKARHDVFLDYRHWLVEFFIPTLYEIEKQVLLSVLQRFDGIYHKWYSILVEDTTKESRIDEEFTPTITQDGYEYEIEFLSGGEKTSIALAYRLALNSLMRQETESLESNLLILDEPTDGFSKAQLSKIRSVLDGLSSEQIILVSHEKELEAYVDNMFHVSKDSGVSRVSQPSVS